MTDRLAIASQIASGLFAGVNYGLDDFEQTEELKDAEEKTVKAIARLSLRMADALIGESVSPVFHEIKLFGLNVRQIRFLINFYKTKTGDVDMVAVKPLAEEDGAGVPVGTTAG